MYRSSTVEVETAPFHPASLFHKEGKKTREMFRRRSLLTALRNSEREAHKGGIRKVLLAFGRVYEARRECAN